MAHDTRLKDVHWTVVTAGQSGASWDGAKLAVLMDLRDELKTLNRLLHCQNFIAIPRVLTEIRRNTTRRKRKKAAPK